MIEELTIIIGLTLISCFFTILKIREFTLLNKEKKLKYKNLVLHFMFSMAGFGYFIIYNLEGLIDRNTLIYCLLF